MVVVQLKKKKLSHILQSKCLVDNVGNSGFKQPRIKPGASLQTTSPLIKVFSDKVLLLLFFFVDNFSRLNVWSWWSDFWFRTAQIKRTTKIFLFFKLPDNFKVSSYLKTCILICWALPIDEKRAIFDKHCSTIIKQLESSKKLKDIKEDNIGKNVSLPCYLLLLRLSRSY